MAAFPIEYYSAAKVEQHTRNIKNVLYNNHKLRINIPCPYTYTMPYHVMYNTSVPNVFILYKQKMLL